MDNDVIVYDGEYIHAGQEIGEYGDALIKLIDDYCICVKYILSNVIRDKEISEELEKIVSALMEIRPVMDEHKQKAKNLCQRYIQEIDMADQFIY